MSDLQILIGGLAECDREWVSEKTSVYKLYYPTAGAGELTIAGKSYAIKPGRLILFDASRLESNAPSEMTVHWLHFVPTSLSLKARLLTAPPVMEWIGPVTRFYKPLLESILVAPRPNDQLAIEGMLLTLLADLLKDVPHTAIENSATTRLQPAIRFMDAHWQDHPTLGQVARAAKLAPNYFHRLFRQTYHTTPRAYLTEKRMNHARELLASTALPVTDVAEAAGYACSFHFSKAFKQHTGRSPKQFRNEQRP